MTKRPRERSKPLLRDDGAPIQSRPIRQRDLAQPQLLSDPMPNHIEPALAKLLTQAACRRRLGWEVKWDGYRLHVHIEQRGVPSHSLPARLVQDSSVWSPVFFSLSRMCASM
ncbi:hypothetical protein [Rhizobium grahamii]|uniref:hypothetical protein n=1 Tax=Rhizobium grahamii TaxID=1120045 RepID=UPI00269CF211